MERERLAGLMTGALTEAKVRARKAISRQVTGWKKMADVVAVIEPALRAGNVGAVLWRDAVDAGDSDPWLDGLCRHVSTVTDDACTLRVARVAGSLPALVLMLRTTRAEQSAMMLRYDAAGCVLPLDRAVTADAATQTDCDDEWEQV